MSDSKHRFDGELDNLFTAYRDACEIPEASPEFMPKLWQRIDAAQPWRVQAWRWAQALTGAAMAASLFIMMMQVVPGRNGSFYNSTYLEVLASDQDSEQLAALGFNSHELPAEDVVQRETPSK